MAQGFAPEPGRIAVLGGTGPEGSALALRWVRAGLAVTIGSRERSRAEATAAHIRERVGAAATVHGLENGEAAASAATLVLTVPFPAQVSTLRSLGDALRPGQVLVDCTVPLATAVGGRPTAMLGVWQGSAAQQAASVVPRGLAVVAAFHNVSAPHLEDLEHPVECDVLVCGDNREAKARVRHLVEAIDGCRYVDAGALATARTVESLTALLIGINIQYKVQGSGIRITGIFEDGHETLPAPSARESKPTADDHGTA